MKIDIDKVKVILEIIEALFSIWLLYRSGRIVLKKGNTEDSSIFMDNDMVNVLCYAVWFCTMLWRSDIFSWVLMYSAAAYLLIYMIFISHSPKVCKIITSVIWIGAVIVLPVLL